jgi:hypothetical protein
MRDYRYDFDCRCGSRYGHRGECDELWDSWRTFNTEHYSDFDIREYDILQDYIDEFELEPKDMIKYVKSCHCCGIKLEVELGIYCSSECRDAIHKEGKECFRKDNCLLCHGYTEENDTQKNTCICGELFIPNCIDDVKCEDCTNLEIYEAVYGYEIWGEQIHRLRLWHPREEDEPVEMYEARIEALAREEEENEEYNDVSIEDLDDVAIEEYDA